MVLWTGITKFCCPPPACTCSVYLPAGQQQRQALTTFSFLLPAVVADLTWMGKEDLPGLLFYPLPLPFHAMPATTTMCGYTTVTGSSTFFTHGFVPAATYCIPCPSHPTYNFKPPPAFVRSLPPSLLPALPSHTFSSLPHQL